MFLELIGQLLVVFSAWKVNNWPRKSNFSVKNLFILSVLRGHLWQFAGSRFKVDLDFLRSVWVLFSTVKGLFLVLFSDPKVDKWSWKMKFSVKYSHFGGFEGSFLTILEVMNLIFWPFWEIKKVVFWTFSKLFRECLGTFKVLF